MKFFGKETKTNLAFGFVIHFTETFATLLKKYTIFRVYFFKFGFITEKEKIRWRWSIVLKPLRLLKRVLQNGLGKFAFFLYFFG